MWVLDGVLVIFALIGLTALSEFMVGDEDALNLLDDAATYSENSVQALLKFWKMSMGEIHSTLYNIFTESLKASPALSKLTAATATMAVAMMLMDVFADQSKKIHGTCLADIFGIFNTPFNFLKATLYDWSHPLGYLADIFLIPFEMVVGIIALIMQAIWSIIMKMGLGNTICQITESSSPCCKPK